MPFVKLTELTDQAFDYIVAGGGTAGLAAATRLSEDPSITVLVLEAGLPNLDDPKIDIPALFGGTCGDPKYDWLFKTTDQKHLKSPLIWSRGKSLGGTSAMNFNCWNKPPAADIDAFEKLGNPGWNWKDYEKYSRMAERFHTPSAEVLSLYPHTFEANQGGNNGPIQVSIPYHAHALDHLIHPSVVKTGLRSNPNVYGGDINGINVCAATIDPATGKRSYSASSYLMPNIGRPNLLVVTEALVSRVILPPQAETEGMVATGVEVIQAGQTFTVKTKGEIIVSAGTVNSPKILELSGIGNPELLKELGISTNISLPGVGENLQEHSCFSLAMELNPDADYETLDLLRDPAYLQKAMELHSRNQGILRSALTSVAFFPLSSVRPKEAAALVEKLEQELKELDDAGKLSASAKQLFELQLEAVRDDTRPDCEVGVLSGFISVSAQKTPEAGKRYLSFAAFLNRAFSKGSIHAVSKDPSVYPAIDPNYFDIDYDLEQLVQQFKYIRDLAQVEPLKSAFINEYDPGPQVSSDEDIRNHIKSNFAAGWHAVGTCSMLPREKDGVVNPQLKVYGTTNLRVADLSIVPLHFVAHPQATAYVIGEKVADMIKVSRSKSSL